MKKQLLITFILSFIISKSLAQEKRKFLYAKITDNIAEISNAHIINTNTNQGTYTNEVGEFRILAKPNDSLKISFVGYKTKVITVKLNHFWMQINSFILERNIIELDEVALKKHNLFGILSRDMKQTPEDVAVVKSKGALDFSMIDFKQPIIKRIDDMERSKAPNIWKEVDPTAKFFGIGGRFNTGSVKKAMKRKKHRKDIQFKENFPKMLISEFGASFFFNDLKIPKENYLHFLEYCNTLNIEQLYKDDKKIDVIKILQEESKGYLKIINLRE